MYSNTERSNYLPRLQYNYVYEVTNFKGLIMSEYTSKFTIYCVIFYKKNLQDTYAP